MEVRKEVVVSLPARRRWRMCARRSGGDGGGVVERRALRKGNGWGGSFEGWSLSEPCREASNGEGNLGIDKVMDDFSCATVSGHPRYQG